MDKFAEILEELICEKGLSLRKLEKESKVSASQYGKYLKGAFPTLDVVVRLTNYFNCSFDYLFGISDNKNYPHYVCKTYNLSVFIQRYEKLLEQNKITHWKFAKFNNLSESCIRHWKYGQTPKIESLIIIAENLSSSIDYLLGRI